MGNLPTSHTLELRVHQPTHLQPPLSSNGKPREVFAKAGWLLSPESARRVAWDKPVSLPLASDSAVILVQIFAARVHKDSADELLAELHLPVSGEGGLADRGLKTNGPPLTLELTLQLPLQSKARPSEGESCPVEEAAAGISDTKPGIRVVVCERLVKGGVLPCLPPGAMPRASESKSQACEEVDQGAAKPCVDGSTRGCIGDSGGNGTADHLAPAEAQWAAEVGKFLQRFEALELAMGGVQEALASVQAEQTARLDQVAGCQEALRGALAQQDERIGQVEQGAGRFLAESQSQLAELELQLHTSAGLVKHLEQQASNLQSHFDERLKQSEEAVAHLQSHFDERLKQSEQAAAHEQSQFEERLKRSEQALTQAQLQFEEQVKESEQAAAHVQSQCEERLKQSEQALTQVQLQFEERVTQSEQALAQVLEREIQALQGRLKESLTWTEQAVADRLEQMAHSHEERHSLLESRLASLQEHLTEGLEAVAKQARAAQGSGSGHSTARRHATPGGTSSPGRSPRFFALPPDYSSLAPHLGPGGGGGFMDHRNMPIQRLPSHGSAGALAELSGQPSSPSSSALSPGATRGLSPGSPRAAATPRALGSATPTLPSALFSGRRVPGAGNPPPVSPSSPMRR